MLNISRVIIASAESTEISMLLERHPMFFISKCLHGFENIEKDIEALSPDVLILDSAFSGRNALALIDWMRFQLPAPPRVLYLARGSEAALLSARMKGVDGVLAWPADAPILLEQACNIAQFPLPYLAEAWQEMRYHIAEELLQQLHIPPTLKGRMYIKEAIAQGACSPWMIHSFSHRLYPWLSQQFHATPQAIERAIRTAIEHIWLKGDLNAIQDLFGFTVDADRGKPTNAEFISMLAGHTHLHLKHHIEKNQNTIHQMLMSMNK